MAANATSSLFLVYGHPNMNRFGLAGSGGTWRAAVIRAIQKCRGATDVDRPGREVAVTEGRAFLRSDRARGGACS